MKNITLLRLTAAGVLLAASGLAFADPLPGECSEVEVTLRHSGRLPAKAMGHDWVLAKDSDVSSIVNAGLAAGPAHGYLPEHDKRIIAATPIVGGGESVTVKFASSLLQAGARYAFFCTSPGHSTVMRGRFIFGGDPRLGRANAAAAK